MLGDIVWSFIFYTLALRECKTKFFCTLRNGQSGLLSPSIHSFVLSRQCCGSYTISLVIEALMEVLRRIVTYCIYCATPLPTRTSSEIRIERERERKKRQTCSTLLVLKFYEHISGRAQDSPLLLYLPVSMKNVTVPWGSRIIGAITKIDQRWTYFNMTNSYTSWLKCFLKIKQFVTVCTFVAHDFSLLQVLDICSCFMIH